MNEGGGGGGSREAATRLVNEGAGPDRRCDCQIRTPVVLWRTDTAERSPTLSVKRVGHVRRRIVTLGDGGGRRRWSRVVMCALDGLLLLLLLWRLLLRR